MAESAEAILAFELSNGEKIADVVRCAIESKTGRVEERIFPYDSKESHDEEATYNHDQRFASVNFTGPGNLHRPRSALGAGVRLLRCADTSEKLIDGLDQECHFSTYVIATHELVPMLSSSPPLDLTECHDIVEKVSSGFVEYIMSMNIEFSQHICSTERVSRQQRMESEAIDNAHATKEGGDSDSTKLECFVLEEKSNSDSSSYHPFFVISFVPRCTGGVTDYSQPLLVVFGSFASEDKALQYATEMLCVRYAKLQLFVVEGGKWIYPRVLNEDDAMKISTVYPNAPKLEAIIKAHATPMLPTF